MSSRHGTFMIIIFVALAIILLMQIFLMIQSDRMYERINRLEENLGISDDGPQAGNEQSRSRTSLPAGRTVRAGHSSCTAVWLSSSSPSCTDLT